MGADDKIKNEAERLGGKIKEGFGDLTDNERLETEGRLDQAEADVKQAAEHASDAARDATQR